MTPARVAAGNLSKESVNMTLAPQTMSATATVISDIENRVALITCAHIFEIPDTLISWFGGNLQPPNAFIRSISICERKDIFVKTISEWGPFNLLAIDQGEDLAIIGRKCEGKTRDIDVFPFPLGIARETAWGNTVYVMSYPLGTLMATKGMVSNPRYDEKGTFLIDAVINRGSSGGVVLSIRNQVPGFEMVGMLKSAFTSNEYFLKPEKDVFETRYDELAPYRGETYVGTSERINYGVSPVIPAEVIRSFYKKNREELIRMGYDLDNFFQP